MDEESANKNNAFWRDLTQDLEDSSYARVYRRTTRKIRRKQTCKEWYNKFAVMLDLTGIQLMGLARAFARTRFLRGLTVCFMIYMSLICIGFIAHHDWVYAVLSGIAAVWHMFCLVWGPTPAPRDIDTEDEA